MVMIECVLKIQILVDRVFFCLCGFQVECWKMFFMFIFNVMISIFVDFV